MVRWLPALCLLAALIPCLGQVLTERDPRRAVVAMVEGKVEAIVEGVSKTAEVGALLPPGATLKTGKNSEVVLFFRQIGTMVRLRQNTTMVLEKMVKYMKDDFLVKETILDLREGEMMCVVRVLLEDSLFSIKIPGFSTKFDGAGIGRFDINSKGTLLVGKRSERPLRVTPVKDPDKSMLVEPGYVYDGGTGMLAPASEKVLAELRPKLDELQNLAKALTPPPQPIELPRRLRQK